MEPNRCAACARGPAGIAGHEQLRVKAMGTPGISFRCEECGSSWTRAYSRDGNYAWAPTPLGALAFAPGPAMPLPQAAEPAGMHWTYRRTPKTRDLIFGRRRRTKPS